jgi:hypothetical protein
MTGTGRGDYYLPEHAPSAAILQEIDFTDAAGEVRLLPDAQPLLAVLITLT